MTSSNITSQGFFFYLMLLLVTSGSWADTLPIEVPTLASSETTILLSGEEKIGGSFMSSTVTLTDVVSLNGPKLRKLESIFLLVTSILRAKLLFVSKSKGWGKTETKNTYYMIMSKGRRLHRLFTTKKQSDLKKRPFVHRSVLSCLCCESIYIDLKKKTNKKNKVMTYCENIWKWNVNHFVIFFHLLLAHWTPRCKT